MANPVNPLDLLRAVANADEHSGLVQVHARKALHLIRQGLIDQRPGSRRFYYLTARGWLLREDLLYAATLYALHGRPVGALSVLYGVSPEVMQVRLNAVLQPAPTPAVEPALAL